MNFYVRKGFLGEQSMKWISFQKQLRGFTLIEILMFIVITGLLVNTILYAFTQLTRKTPNLFYQAVALQTARQCVDWLVGQRQVNGYSSISCPSSTTPSFCTTPSGYSLAINISCTTINGDNNYKTITATVSGNGSASLSTLLANY